MKCWRPIVSKQSILIVLSMGVTIFVVIGVPGLRLVSASLEPSGDTIAIIENKETGNQVVVDLNSNVFGAGTVIDIQNGEVSIEENNGQSYTLKAQGQRIAQQKDPNELRATKFNAVMNSYSDFKQQYPDAFIPGADPESKMQLENLRGKLVELLES